jgi:endoglucanase
MSHRVPTDAPSAIASFATSFLTSATLTLLIISLTPGPVIGQESTASLPLIRVDGSHFVGPDGETVMFRGFSFSDPGKLERDGQWNRALFEEARTRWNANIVRLPVHPSAWRERGEQAYLALLDDGLRWAEETSLYVILDWHTIGNLRTELFQNPMYNTTKTETLRFWKSIAARYGNRPVVAFYELFNEPTRFNGTLGRISWDDFKGYMEEIIYMIRAHNARGIPLVAGFNWAYDLTEPAANPIDAPDVAYVTHPYPQKRPQPWEEKWQVDWGFMAERYPVMVTEFGFMSADLPGSHIPVIADETYGEAIIDFMERRGISWVAWVFDPQWSPQLIENWDFTATLQGRFFRQKMMELNQQP